MESLLENCAKQQSWGHRAFQELPLHAIIVQEHLHVVPQDCHMFKYISAEKPASAAEQTCKFSSGAAVTSSRTLQHGPPDLNLCSACVLPTNFHDI